MVDLGLEADLKIQVSKLVGVAEFWSCFTKLSASETQLECDSVFPKLRLCRSKLFCKNWTNDNRSRLLRNDLLDLMLVSSRITNDSY